MASKMPVPSTEHISKEHAASIGRVAVEWSKLEFYMDTWLALLAGMSTDIGRCITTQIGVHARRWDAIISLVELHGGDEKLMKSLRKLCAVSMGLSERRNRIVHDVWLAAEGSGDHYRIEITARKSLVFEYKTIPLEDLEKCAVDILNHRTAFKHLAEEQFVRLPGVQEMYSRRKLPSSRETPA